MSDAPAPDWRTRERALNAAIAHALRERRLTLGVLQAQVAAYVGLAESTFSRHESGQRIISAALLCAIASYLHQPITALIPHELAGPGAAAHVADDPSLDAIVQTLRARPDLVPLVEGLLETLLADTHQPAP